VIDAVLVRGSEPAGEGRFDCLLIDSSGISESMPVAATFAFPRDDGTTLDCPAQFDTMVTVPSGCGRSSQRSSAPGPMAECCAPRASSG
jgi:hypothetical protein